MNWTPILRRCLLAGLALCLLLPGCTDSRRYDQAICVLVDVSGTYAEEKGEVVRILKREVLPAMLPGDTLVLIRIDSESYQKDNVEALVTLDPRPSKANAQKLALAQKLDAMAIRRDQANHTDIPGAMMLGSEYLRELASGSRVMLIFSDMQEDLEPGTRRDLDDEEFTDVSVVAMNVKRLQGDTNDPAVFRSRMDHWRERILAAGGASWRTIMDPTKLPEYLEAKRSS
jgi:hypothetical protein